MIITTNAEIKDMDEAIERPCRLTRNIHVGPLPYEQANRRFQDLTKNNVNLDYQKFYTLAEIYNVANNVGNPAPSHHTSKSRRSIGFSQPPEEKEKEGTRDLTINKKMGF
jgi:hypothetical protein